MLKGIAAKTAAVVFVWNEVGAAGGAFLLREERTVRLSPFRITRPVHGEGTFVCFSIGLLSKGQIGFADLYPDCDPGGVICVDHVFQKTC